MSSDDIRLGDIVDQGDHGDIVLLGFPYDEGVARNNGRVGARLGPKFFRQSLQRTGPVVNVEFDDLDIRQYLNVSDGGDIQEGLQLEEGHQLLEERVTQLIKMNKIPFVVGGGNDQSFFNACGLMNNLEMNQSICVINIDAHLDVRPLKSGNKSHSGSPFRQLLEDQRFNSNSQNRFVEFACQSSQCSIEHIKYLREKSSQVDLFWFHSIRDDPLTPFRSLLAKSVERQSSIFVSFDIDSIISSSCPGVSAPATLGLTAQQACDLSFQSGLCSNVKLMDLSEFNPQIEHYRTGKLVALLFYHFILGRAKSIQQSNSSN